jgi:hypothetical protein
VNFEGLFHTIATTINTYMNIVSKELFGFQSFHIDKVANACYIGGKNKNTSF